MSARDRILARLRAAAPAAVPEAPDVADFYARRGYTAPPAERLARFRREIEASHAEVHVTSANDWPALVARLCAEKELRTLACGLATAHGQRLAATPGIPDLAGFDRPLETWKPALFDAVDASLTAARSAIAETGTLILWPDADEPRTLSLVPPVHFVLLDTSRLHANLFDAIRDEGWHDGLPTNALLVSGPSKTADIQQTLAYGAHGPKELIVLLIDGGAA